MWHIFRTLAQEKNLQELIGTPRNDVRKDHGLTIKGD